MRPEAARRQLDADEAAKRAAIPAEYGDETGSGDGRQVSNGGPDAARGGTTVVVEKRLRRFHGSVALDATRLGRDAGRIAEEVVSHLAGLVGSRVEITLEIHAEIPDGVPDKVVRDVTENCRTLRFSSYGFEEA